MWEATTRKLTIDSSLIKEFSDEIFATALRGVNVTILLIKVFKDDYQILEGIEKIKIFLLLLFMVAMIWFAYRVCLGLT